MAILGINSRNIVMIFCVLAALCTVSPCAQADDIKLTEQKIKAGLVYNFLKYTTWPQSAFKTPEDPLQVCLIGGDPFDGYLHPINGRTAQQRTINIRILRDATGIGKCHFAYIDGSLEGRVSDILGMIEGRPVLMASDAFGFARNGGMIEFAMKDQRIHLSVNRTSLDKAGISIENRLLKLAEFVR